ncbi:MAG: hypothetical protein AB1505_23250, partial [Candidatus Latescibacterota bacterium]
MHAVLIATGGVPAPGTDGLRPAPLRPLVDRPFIQHVVECLVQEGITELDLVLSDRPEEVSGCWATGRAGAATSGTTWCDTLHTRTGRC